MRFQGLIAGAALAFAVSACASGINVSTDWDPGVDFGAFQTFTVLDEEGAGASLVDRRISNAIVANLQAKGWRHAEDADEADVAVGFELTTDERSSFQTVSSGWDTWGYRWGRWYGPSMTTTTARTTETRYEVGTLVIAMFDQESKEMIFASTGSKTLQGDNPSPEEIEARVNEAVARILEDFPPGGGM
jgi:hypothetical protein